MLIKIILILGVIAIILGIGYFAYSKFSPNPKTPVQLLTGERQTVKPLGDIPVNTFNPPQPINVLMFAPKQTEAVGKTVFSPVANRMLIKINMNQKSSGNLVLVTKGTCSTAKTEIVYPLLPLKDGSSESVWEINREDIQKLLPLSVKTFKDAKTLTNYQTCGEIKIS